MKKLQGEKTTAKNLEENGAVGCTFVLRSWILDPGFLIKHLVSSIQFPCNEKYIRGNFFGRSEP